MKFINPNYCKGQVIIIFALSLFVLVGMVGLAIDSGLAYGVKAKLSAAVDAAAIAGARALAVGATDTERKDNAKAAAQKFFYGNFPSKYLGATPTVPNTVAVHDSRGYWTVTVTAKAVMPTTFIRVLSLDQVNVAALGETIRRDLDLVLVLDVTDSIVTDDKGKPAPEVGIMLKSRAKEFLSKLDTDYDRVALVHFAYGAFKDVPFKSGGGKGFKRCKTSEPPSATRPTSCETDSMYYKIDPDAWCGDTESSCTGGSSPPPGLVFDGFTNYAEGMWNARDQIKSITSPSSLQVIVFFSDGSPNTFASYFTFKSPDASCSNKPGAIATGSAANGTPDGLYQYLEQNSNVPLCNWSNVTSHLTTTALPAWYNAHNRADIEFPVVTNAPRVVTNNTSSTNNTWKNVNRASRNLAESMAAKGRSEGIYVFTLGLGAHLSDPSGPDNEKGDIVLKCMANTKDCPRHDSNSLVGIYCPAATAAELGPCFDQILSEILRLSK